MKFTANEIADILNADSITGNKSLEANQLILRAATAAALPDSVYFDLRKFKDPPNAIERMHNLGVRIFVYAEPLTAEPFSD